MVEKKKKIYFYDLRPSYFFILCFIYAVLMSVGILTELSLLKLVLILILIGVIYAYMFFIEYKEKQIDKGKEVD